MNRTELLFAYTTAVYKTETLDFTLSHLPNDTILFSNRTFAIITAYNPRSQVLSNEENYFRHLQLQNVLQKKAFETSPSTGQSPDGSWSEAGFLVFDIGLDEALEIGRSFEQHAILYGQGNRVALAWCEGGLEWFYPKVIGDGFRVL